MKKEEIGNLTVMEEGLEIDNDKGYSKENCQSDENKLKQKVINLTPMDIHFIRSPYFDWRKYFTCSDLVY